MLAIKMQCQHNVFEYEVTHIKVLTVDISQLYHSSCGIYYTYPPPLPPVNN